MSSTALRSKYTVNPGYTPVADCFCVRFSPDDQYLATSYANGAIHVYSTETGRQEFLLNGSPSHTELSATPLPTTQLRWRPQGAAKTQSVPFTSPKVVESSSRRGVDLGERGV